MIILSLLMLGFMILTGVGLKYYFQSKTALFNRDLLQSHEDLDNNKVVPWWDKSSLSIFFLRGFVAAAIFLFICMTLINCAGMLQYSNASAVDSVLERMDYVKAPGVTDNNFYENVAAWFKTDNDGRYNAAIAETNPNYPIYREKFLYSFLVDASPDLIVKNPHSMLEDVANEKLFPYINCSSASNILLAIWAKSYTGGEIGKWGTADESTSCVEAIAGEIQKAEKNPECNANSYLTMIEDHVENKVKPSYFKAFKSLLLGKFNATNSEIIITGAPRGKGCGNVFDNKNGKLEREIISAQINILRESVAGAYRIGAVVFGPIQVILLTIFFAACIGLGQRRRLTLEGSNSNLNKFIESRFKLAYSHNKSVSVDAVKNAIYRELDEEASFPFTFSVYVLGMIGFIGTVIGIAASLGDSGAVVRAASLGVSAQEEAISNITGMLGVAFDTTLIALGTSALVFYIHSYIKSLENATIRNYKYISNSESN